MTHRLGYISAAPKNHRDCWYKTAELYGQRLRHEIASSLAEAGFVLLAVWQEGSIQLHIKLHPVGRTIAFLVAGRYYLSS